MKLHNTLTRRTEDFEPLHKDKVRIYSCGPTVYDHLHIGNLAGFIAADTLRRVLKTSGNDVRHIMNITDVDDKTIKRSSENYPDDSPEEALRKLAEEYTQIFLDDMRAVGNDIDALELTKATDSIEGMRALIRELYDDGFAYIADDGVYFSIEKYRASGKKYGQLTEITEANTSEARIQNDEYDKENVHDFALWKTRKDEEPAWEFELDGHDLLGRPGWHIECSVMSVAKLGQPFDIHTGGVDLKFPHHENEIAQSTAGAGDVYAKFFVHNEHLLVEGKKMSKSLNNFYTLQDIKEKGFDPLAFRLMVLQSHYRSQSNFSWEILEAAQNRLDDIRVFAASRFQTFDARSGNHLVQGLELDKAWADIADALMDDLNSPLALKSLSEIQKQVELRGIDNHSKESFERFISNLDSVFGLGLSALTDISNDQKEILARRQKARDEKDFAESDKLRDQLKEQGIGVRDTPQGQIWFRLD